MDTGILIIKDVRNQLPKHKLKIYKKRKISQIKYIAVHHSATTSGDAFSFARYHVDYRNWPGIGYHYVILPDGTIQWTNDLTTISYHVGIQNTFAVGVCLVGDFSKGQPTEQQKISLKSLCRMLFGLLNLNINNVKGHRELTPGTLCPVLDMNEVREYISSDKITILLEGKPLTVDTMFKDNTTFASIRPLAKALGYDVNWDAQTQTVNLVKIKAAV